MEKKQDAADAVLSLIAAKPQLSHEVREELVKRGFSGSEVRTAGDTRHSTVCPSPLRWTARGRVTRPRGGNS